LIKLTFEPL